MRILAIDPGPEQSAWLIFDTETNMPVENRFGIDSNRVVMGHCRKAGLRQWSVALEMVASYGMPVGATIFETVLWTGGFWQATNRTARLIYRRDVKMHLCNSVRAKDSNIRQALIDRFGPGKEEAVGTKKNPGPLYRIKKDLWSALALAVTYADQNVRAGQ